MADNVVNAPPRTAEDWFIQAIRAYTEDNQTCPSCHARHRVFRAGWGSRTEYHCIECDFSAAHDEQTGTFCATLGEAAPSYSLVLMGRRRACA
jgi:hypothetical protein